MPSLGIIPRPIIKEYSPERSEMRLRDVRYTVKCIPSPVSVSALFGSARGLYR